METNRYLVQFYGASNAELIESLGGKVRHDFKTISESLSAIMTDEIAEIVAQHISVKLVEKMSKNNRGGAQSMDWGYVYTQVSTRYRGLYTGSGVKVAILDTGMSNHSDLNSATEFEDFVNFQSSQYDDHGHGTFIAGIIAAQDNTSYTVGVAPAVDLYIGKVLDEFNSGWNDDFIAGIEWAIDRNVDIINFSIWLSSTQTEAQRNTVLTATRAAYSAGIIVVAISGNGTDNDNVAVPECVYPAIDYSCLAVGSINSSGARSYFSNYGTGLDLVAPGENIKSLYYGGGTTYDSGTSFAVPYVVGHLAILKGKYPSYSRSQLVSQLLSGCNVLGSSYEYGAGTVYAEAPPIPATPSAPLISSRIEGGFNVYWGSVVGATSYTLKYTNYIGTYTKVVSGTSTSLTGLFFGTTYLLSVGANNSSGSSAYSSENPATTAPKTPSISQGTVTNTSIQIYTGTMSGNYDAVYIERYSSGGTLLETKTSTGSSNVTFTGLTSGTAYVFKAYSTFYISGVTLISVSYSNTLTITSSARPANWSWVSTVASGSDILISADEWNDFADRVNLFRAYKGLFPYGFTTVYSGWDWYAYVANQGRNAINDMSPPTGVPSTVTSGVTTISASFFNGLKDSLNSIP